MEPETIPSVIRALVGEVQTKLLRFIPRGETRPRKALEAVLKVLDGTAPPDRMVRELRKGVLSFPLFLEDHHIAVQNYRDSIVEDLSPETSRILLVTGCCIRLIHACISTVPEEDLAFCRWFLDLALPDLPE